MCPKPGKTTEVEEPEETEELEGEESEETEGDQELTQEELKNETAGKIKKAEKKLGKKIPENIIGPIEPTSDDVEDRKAVAAYRKRVEKKLDSIFERLPPVKKPEEQTPPPAPKPEPKKPWYDREFF